MNILVPVVAVSPLRQRLIDEMEIRRFGRETQRNYIRDVGRFATFLGRSPDTATVEEVRRFQVEQCDLGVPVPTMNAIVSALRFFFTQTLGHVEACTDCGHWRVAYNSCRNRHCPRCQGAAARTWLAEREADLLPVGYFHVVFTLPAEVADIAWQNKAAVYGLLFQAASETMTTIAADPKHLGARIGITAVLHTWGSALTHHPHIHMIVPGGGLSPDGSRWVSSRPAFLLPVRVLAKLFRRLFLAGLIALHAAGRLAAFGSLSPLAERRAFLRHLAP
ncbi:MAG TPA: transposase zinc-binding domain-containing protein, partial [Sphingomicrobium sp.]